MIFLRHSYSIATHGNTHITAQAADNPTVTVVSLPCVPLWVSTNAYIKWVIQIFEKLFKFFFFNFYLLTLTHRSTSKLIEPILRPRAIPVFHSFCPKDGSQHWNRKFHSWLDFLSKIFHIFRLPKFAVNI